MSQVSNVQAAGSADNVPVWSNSKLTAAPLSPTDTDQIIWRTKDVSNGVISGEGKNLTILKDGYYFLSLQVTLKTPKCSFNGTRGSENSQSVSVTLTGDMTRDTTRKILLQGRISTHTCSTGLLSKAEKLTAGKKLTFNITLPPREIDNAAHRTHLDIIFFLKPQMIWWYIADHRSIFLSNPWCIPGYLFSSESFSAANPFRCKDGRVYSSILLLNTCTNFHQIRKSNHSTLPGVRDETESQGREERAGLSEDLTPSKEKPPLVEFCSAKTKLNKLKINLKT